MSDISHEVWLEPHEVTDRVQSVSRSVTDLVEWGDTLARELAFVSSIADAMAAELVQAMPESEVLKRWARYIDGVRE